MPDAFGVRDVCCNGRSYQQHTRAPVASIRVRICVFQGSQKPPFEAILTSRRTCKKPESMTIHGLCAKGLRVAHTGCGPPSAPLSATVRRYPILQSSYHSSIRRHSPPFAQVGISVGITLIPPCRLVASTRQKRGDQRIRRSRRCGQTVLYSPITLNFPSHPSRNGPQRVPYRSIAFLPFLLPAARNELSNCRSYDGSCATDLARRN